MAIVLLLILGFVVIAKTKTPDLRKYDLYIGWGIKLLFGVLFMVVHTKIYGIGDITVDWEEYMDDSVTLNHVAYQSFGDYLKFLFGLNSEWHVQHYLANTHHWSAGDLDLMNDSRNVLRVNSLLVFLSNGNVYVHILFFSFFSFIGLREIFLAFKDRVFINKRLFWYALFLFPTLSFWTSSVLKEPFVITGIALMLNALLGELSWKSRLWRALLGFWLMLSFKPYVLACLLVSIPVFILGKWVYKKRPILAPLTVLITLFLILGLSSGLRNNLTHRMTRMQFDFMNVGRGGVHVIADSAFYYFSVEQYPNLNFSDSGTVEIIKPITAKKVTTGMSYPFEDVRLKPQDGPWKICFEGTACGSYIELTSINSDFGQLIRTIPEALTNAALRPYFWDPGGNLKIVNTLETFALFALLLFSFWHNWGNRSFEERNIIYFLLTFSFSLLVLIGWTTPILGAIVRYRMPAYLALFLVAMLGSRPFKSKI